MYAGGLSYVSRCFLACGFHIGAWAEAVAIDAMDISKIERVIVDIVENFIRWKWLKR